MNTPVFFGNYNRRNQEREAKSTVTRLSKHRLYLFISTTSLAMQPIQLPTASDALVTVSKAHEHVWTIEMHNGADNRLSEPMCKALASALDIVEQAWRDVWRVAYNDKNDQEKIKGSGALIIIANRKQQKFFSNGFDYPTLLKRPHFIPSECFVSKGRSH